MKIAVCIKRVPEMDVRFRIASSGTAIDEAGLKFDIDDFDGYAVEAALQINEKRGARREVVVIRSAPTRRRRRCARRSAWAPIAPCSSRPTAFPLDGLAIAKALAAELKDGGYDLDPVREAWRSTRRTAPSAR